jgi:hypothetical protein
MKEAAYAQEALKLDTQGKDATLYSALQGVLAFPLPFPWAASASKDQRIYFYHRGLKLSVWDHPMLDMHKELSSALACGVQQKRQVESNLRGLLDKIRSRRTIQRIIEVWQGPLQARGRTIFASEETERKSVTITRGWHVQPSSASKLPWWRTCGEEYSATVSK